MSSIGSIGSSVSYSGYADSLRRQAPDPSKIADTIFSKLDSKGQGYLEVSDLQSAFTKLSGNSSSTSVSTDQNQPDASDLFKKLDGNGDGKLTKSEFSDGLKALAQQFESQFNSSRTSYADGVQGGQRPSGPPPGAESGGLNKSQLSGLASQVAQSDSKAGSDLNSVAKILMRQTLTKTVKCPCRKHSLIWISRQRQKVRIVLVGPKKPTIAHQARVATVQAQRVRQIMIQRSLNRCFNYCRHMLIRFKWVGSRTAAMVFL